MNRTATLAPQNVPEEGNAEASREEVAEHLHVLGLIATSAYKLWCRRHGFSTSLRKTGSELASERDFATEAERAAQASRSHDQKRAAYIRRIASGDLDGQPVTDIGAQVRRLFTEVDGVDGGREALLGLVLHVEKYGNLLTGSRGYKVLGDTLRNQVISGLSQLARHHRDWIRPLEKWHPAMRKPANQFRSLAAHLFARYDVPACLNAAWFEGDLQEAAIQQRWYIHIGRGQNIRTAEDLPYRLTKRTAHLFMTSPSLYPPPLSNLRMAQCLALDGNVRVQRRWELTSHERIRGREHADFWTAIVHFLINNPMLEQNYIGALIDYVHYTKFENRRVPQPGGSVRMLPPVHPNFSIKGRSIDKLIREVDDWHEQLSGEEYDYLEEWDPSGLTPFELVEDNVELAARIHWTIQELHTSALLQLEGRMMRHCVGSYTKRCISGEVSIWSLRARADGEDAPQQHVLTIAVDNKRRKVTQALGKFNLSPSGPKTSKKRRKVDSNYRTALHESARILALWRRQEGLGISQK